MATTESYLLFILLIVLGSIAFNFKKIFVGRKEFDEFREDSYKGFDQINQRLDNFKDDKGNRLTFEKVVEIILENYNSQKKNQQ